MNLNSFWKEGFNFENIDLRWKLLFIPIIIAWMSYAILKSNPYSIHKEWEKIHLSDSFNDIVSKKWTKRERKYFILKDSTKGIGYNVICDKLDVGDSLIKKKNARIFKIVKAKKILFINLDVEFKYLDSLVKNGKY